MKNNYHLTPCVIAMALSLSGCFGSNDTSDIQAFIDDVSSRPRGSIEPIPVFKPYQSFIYSASSLRSPFEQPVQTDPDVEIKTKGSSVKPDLDRPKEHLEFFTLSELAMVGTIQGKDRNLWALIKDGDGSIVRVKKGQHMGQNHGRVVNLSQTKISLIEIVPDGLGGWVERPKTIALNGLSGK